MGPMSCVRSVVDRKVVTRCIHVQYMISSKLELLQMLFLNDIKMYPHGLHTTAPSHDDF